MTQHNTAAGKPLAGIAAAAAAANLAATAAQRYKRMSGPASRAVQLARSDTTKLPGERESLLPLGRAPAAASAFANVVVVVVALVLVLGAGVAALILPAPAQSYFQFEATRTPAILSSGPEREASEQLNETAHEDGARQIQGRAQAEIGPLSPSVPGSFLSSAARSPLAFTGQ